MALLAILTPFMFFVAFLLLLLATLSVPIIKSIYLFAIGASVDIVPGPLTAEVEGNVKFGVWGYCTSGIQGSAFGISQSTAAECSKAKLGYTIDSQVMDFLDLVNGDSIADAIQRTLTFVLVLHPIACGLTFLALLLALFSVTRSSKGRFASLLATCAGILAAIVTTIVFIIDIVLVAVARSRIHSATQGNAWANWGNAVWMVLGAVIALWIGTVGTCFGIFAGRRRERTTERY